MENMQNKKAIIISLSTAVFGCLIFLGWIAYDAGLDFVFSFFDYDGFEVFAYLFGCIFLFILLFLKLCLRPGKKYKVLFGALLAMSIGGWFAVDSGYYYLAVRQIIALQNPYNGDYSGQVVGGQQNNNPNSFSLFIEGANANIYGLRPNQPVARNSYNVCFVDDKMVLRNGRSKLWYCSILPSPDILELVFVADSDSGLTCQNCQDLDFPVSWVLDK